MNFISSGGLGLLDRVGSSRVAFATPKVTATPAGLQHDRANPGTRVTLGQRHEAQAVVYPDPRSAGGMDRSWLSPVAPNDNVSALMARNLNLHSYNLSDQWRGLGGALLRRFADNGENFTQSVVDHLSADGVGQTDDLSAADSARRAADIALEQASDLADVAHHASTAGMKIQTRSGHYVELGIAVNNGVGSDAVGGMKVEIKASGEMSAEEREAIEQLASGLDRVLEGLGQDDAVQLDLADLLGYDRSVLSSVDLDVKNAMTHQMLSSFSLHLGDDDQSIALKGHDGEVNLHVDASSSLANVSALQRGAAMQAALERFDSAGQRGNANLAQIEQLKTAFKQLQEAGAAKEGAGEEPSGKVPVS